MLATFRDYPELAVRADPKLGVNLIVGDDLADENVTRKEVVVHGFLHDRRDRSILEFDKGIVFRGTSLNGGERGRQDHEKLVYVET